MIYGHILLFGSILAAISATEETWFENQNLGFHNSLNGTHVATSGFFLSRPPPPPPPSSLLRTIPTPTHVLIIANMIKDMQSYTLISNLLIVREQCPKKAWNIYFILKYILFQWLFSTKGYLKYILNIYICSIGWFNIPYSLRCLPSGAVDNAGVCEWQPSYQIQ